MSIELNIHCTIMCTVTLLIDSTIYTVNTQFYTIHCCFTLRITVKSECYRHVSCSALPGWMSAVPQLSQHLSRVSRALMFALCSVTVAVSSLRDAWMSGKHRWQYCLLSVKASASFCLPSFRSELMTDVILTESSIDLLLYDTHKGFQQQQ